MEKLEKMQKEAQETVKEQDKEERILAAKQREEQGGFSWWPSLKSQNEIL